MNKSEFIDKLSHSFDGNRALAARALEAVMGTITREVARGEKVAITGFGAFEKAVRPARMVRNPQTGARIQAKRTTVPKFRAGADLKAVVSGAKKAPAATVALAASPARGTSSSTTKKTAKKSTAKKTAKKAAKTAKKTAKKTTKKSPAKRSAAKKTAKKSTTKRSPAKKTAKKAAKKSPARKTAKKSTAKRSTAKRTAKKR